MHTMTPEFAPGRLYTNFDARYDQLRMRSEHPEAIPERPDAIAAKKEQTRARIERAIAVSMDNTISFGSKMYNPDAQLGEAEWNDGLKFVEKLGPITKKNWSLHLHLRHVAETARLLIEQLQTVGAAEFEDLDPGTVRLQGLFHSIGRVAGQFNYLRSEYESQAIMKRLGMQHLAVDTVRLGHRFKELEELTAEEKLIMYADMCGGVDMQQPSVIQTYDDRLDVHRNTRTLEAYPAYTNSPVPAFATELTGLVALDRGDKDRYTELYEKLDRYFRDLGIDRERIREEVMKLEAESEDPVLQSLHKGARAFPADVA